MNVPGVSSGSAPAARRRKWILAALGATIAATAWSAFVDDDKAVVAAIRPTSSSRSETGARPSSGPATVLAPKLWPPPRRPQPGSSLQVDALAWSGVAPTAAVAASATPAQDKPFIGPSIPLAPAFGYALIGRLDDGEPRALLTGPLRSFDVRAGDVLDGQWRIDAVTVDGLVVTWLPTDKRQKIGFKSS